MPDPALLDQLISQQTARQGHPLRQLPPSPSQTPPPSPQAAPGDPASMRLVSDLFGPTAFAEGGPGLAALKLLGQRQLPSEVYGSLAGQRGDIDLPPANAAVAGLQRAQ